MTDEDRKLLCGILRGPDAKFFAAHAADEIERLIAENKRLREQRAAWEQTTRTALTQFNAEPIFCEGHGEPCYYCGKPVSSISSQDWPIALLHKDEPGVMKWHHSGCVMERLVENMPQSAAKPVAWRLDAEIAKAQDENAFWNRIRARAKNK